MVQTKTRMTRRASMWMLASVATTLLIYWVAGRIFSMGGQFSETVGVGMVVALPALIFSLFINGISGFERRDYFRTLGALFIGILIATSTTASQMGDVLGDPEFYWPTFLVNAGLLLVSLAVAVVTAPRRAENRSPRQPSAPRPARRSSGAVIGALVLGLMLGAFIRLR